MSRRLATLLFVGLAALSLSASQALAAGARPRIVQGAPTAIAQAPFQVALYDPQLIDPHEPSNLLVAQFCGGVIRDATHVVTAAHCVTLGGFEAAAPGEIEVLAGSANLEAPEAGSIRDPVVATSFDPEWEPFGFEHDIGVLTLEKPLWEGLTPEIGGVGVKIAPIGFAATDPLAGSAATISGWGLDQPLTPEQELSEAEEKADHPAILRSAGVSIVSRSQCSADYANEGLPSFGEQFICAAGNSPLPADSCYGDSGGPLFSGTPGEPSDELLGLVDFGAGCGQEGSPGVYQSVIEANNRTFAQSDPPQAPRNTAEPTIGGGSTVGETLSCNPGSWLGAPEFLYRFYRDESSITRPFAVKALTPDYAPSATYVTQSGDAGGRIFCAVAARNAGGLGEAISDEVSITAATAPILITAPVTPPAPAPTEKPAQPTLRLLSARCRRGSCTVTVRTSKGSGDAQVTRVEAKLLFTRKLACRKHGRRAKCTRTFTRKLAARSIGGERFSIVAGDLKPGPYTMTLVAIDKLGLRQARASKVALLLPRFGARPR
ncbi:MAG TPA: serine protease [Solirubrobacteraceae bacterium]|jgi:secreted trypsin-like serine protease